MAPYCVDCVTKYLKGDYYLSILRFTAILSLFKFIKKKGTTLNRFQLFTYFRSSASFRVRIALNLKGIQSEYHYVHLVKNGGEQFSPEYTKLNPSSQVPTLIHGEHIIGQSMAIMDYLEHIKPSPALYSAQPELKSLQIQACEIINSGIQPLHNLMVLKQLEKMCNFTQEQKNEWSRFWINKGMKSFSDLIEAHHKDSFKFSFGNEVGAVECFLVPAIFNMKRYSVDMKEFKTLNKIFENCMKLEAFKKAAPENQADFEA